MFCDSGCFIYFLAYVKKHCGDFDFDEYSGVLTNLCTTQRRDSRKAVGNKQVTAKKRITQSKRGEKKQSEKNEKVIVLNIF